MKTDLNFLGMAFAVFALFIVQGPSWAQDAISASKEDGWTPQTRELVHRFAPVLYHHPREKNFPANVDWFLERSTLGFFDFSGPKKTN